MKCEKQTNKQKKKNKPICIEWCGNEIHLANRPMVWIERTTSLPISLDKFYWTCFDDRSHNFHRFFLYDSRVAAWYTRFYRSVIICVQCRWRWGKKGRGAQGHLAKWIHPKYSINWHNVDEIVLQCCCFMGHCNANIVVHMNFLMQMFFPFKKGVLFQRFLFPLLKG